MNTCFMIVGFSVVIPTMVFLIVFCNIFGQLSRFVNNQLAKRLIQAHGLIKVQIRRYLTFVWDKENTKKETGNNTEDSI